MIKSIFDPSMWTAILPRSISYDDQIKAIAAAFDRSLMKVSLDSREVIFLARLDELDHPILDLLASQFHVDFYDDQLSLEQKRQLIRESIADHRLRGTKYAVEKYSRMIFRKLNIEEWFKYNVDRPYYFRIRIDISSDDEDTTVAARDRLRRVVDITKPVRAWLDVIIFMLNYSEDVPSDEACTISVKMSHADTYDYRADNFQHDGLYNYGRDAENYGVIGQIDYSGDFTYEHAVRYNKAAASNVSYGNFADISYGRTQANDFEVLTMNLKTTHVEAADAKDAGSLTVKQIVRCDGKFSCDGVAAYDGFATATDTF